MFAWMTRTWLLPAFAPLALHCGSDDSARWSEASASNEWREPNPASEAPVDGPALHIEQRTQNQIAGQFLAGDRTIEFASTRSAPFAGDVTIGAGALSFDLHYEYDRREVVTDGNGAAIDRSSQLLLTDAIASLSERLGATARSLPLHEQMLYAGLAMLEESGGMPLMRTTFTIDGPEVDKSLGNDGVTCIERGASYPASFDHGGTLVADEAITAGASDCNGQCGPSCTQLTPWRMWTLDCLEHDACCGATSNDPCWTPLGECGDEYVDAETDFLRGFDPFGAHCGG
jgi:hypothetical protein